LLSLPFANVVVTNTKNAHGVRSGAVSWRDGISPQM
jgi:hypothetical protein